MVKILVYESIATRNAILLSTIHYPPIHGYNVRLNIDEPTKGSATRSNR